MSLTALPADKSEFDAVAENYESALQQGLKVSGEPSAYFAVSRMEWTKRRLESLGIRRDGNKAIDFGCGTGNSLPYLRSILGFTSLVGLDPSAQSLRVARRLHPDPAIHFATPDAYRFRGDADLVFCNGVFHHIPPSDRFAAMTWIWDRLKTGGCFAFWENNPWNPGTRYIMSRIPFDRDAITLSMIEARRLIQRVGFRVLSIDTCFYFPRIVKWLRCVEPCLCKTPLGAQYLVLAQKMD